MARLVLTQIVKNESHVITRMLDSIKPIVDIVCIVDTGSTDNTIEVINKWGQENSIETHVFERSFDNFENSRNYSIQMAKEIIKDRGNDWWGFWLDADEVIQISPKFNKAKMDKDFYMFRTHINSMQYTRNECFKLDKPFRFYGPIHEFLVCDDPSITSGLMEGIDVIVRMDGGSWNRPDIHEKYRHHSEVLEKYLLETNKKDPRWIFYTAQSFQDSAGIPDNPEENKRRLEKAISYYKERSERQDGYPEERYFSQFRLGQIMRFLKYPWETCMQELLKAHSWDPIRVEPIKAIIDHYLSVSDFNNAYMFSKYAVITFHGKSPYPNRRLFIDESLYVWRLLEIHAASCFYTGKKIEAKETYKKLLSVMKSQPKLFTEVDIDRIQKNKPSYFS